MKVEVLVPWMSWMTMEEREATLDSRLVARDPYVVTIAHHRAEGFEKTLTAVVNVRSRSILFEAQAWRNGVAGRRVKTATLTKAIYAYNEMKEAADR